MPCDEATACGGARRETMDWGATSRAARDAAYNNGAAVANSAALGQARREASAVYRTAHATALDLPYGTGQCNKWDLYPGADAAAPCLVFIHAGYWQMNDREGFACLAEGLAAHSWSVALPGYTPAPEASLGAIAAELRAALDWLSKNAANHGVGGPLVLSGWSAGGHLTTLLLDHPAVAAGVAIRASAWGLPPSGGRGNAHARQRVLLPLECERLACESIPCVWPRLSSFNRCLSLKLNASLFDISVG
ncbi:MAG: alpha/beta hydrolase, partial [Bradyrhizobiaceae bacterium]|nr:alpha/beta hydrolase [Bradyrhizobiaceae bacterium]